MRHRLRLGLAAGLCLASSVPASALGTASYSSELVSTRSLGQGGTGVAGVHEDPVAAYTNPAAMTALSGTQVAAGLTYVNSSPKFTGGSTSAGGLASNYTATNQGDVSGARATNALVPSFAATTRFLDGRLAVGLAAVTPYGLETHWDGDSPLRYKSTDARLRIVDVTPAVAYKVSDAVSVGVGLDYYSVIEGVLEKKMNMQALNFKLAGSPAARPDANSRLNGMGDGLGYHLGLTFRPSERHQIGLAYHSSVRIGLRGNVQLTGLNGPGALAVFGASDFVANAKAPLYMPQNAQIGYAYMPTERTQLEVDAAWYDWYSARQLGVVYDGLTASQSAVLDSPTSNPTQFKPRRTVNFGFGVNHKCTDSFAGRVGGYYQAAALPEDFFSAAFVDLPRYALTLGGGWKVAEGLSADFAYNAVFFHGRAVDAPSTAGQGYHGTFNGFANILSAALTYRTAAHL